MPRKPAPKASPGPTKPRQFRFTDSEIADLDALAMLMHQPGVFINRTTVLRLALQEFKARMMKDASPD